MTPICSKCIYLTGEAVRFRPCAKIPIFHRNMLCRNENNMIKDKVSGDSYTPFCEEVNRHGECLEYYPSGLKAPEITFIEDDNLIIISGTSPIVFTTDGANGFRRILCVDRPNKGSFLSIKIFVISE